MISPYISQQPVDDFGLTFPDLKYSAALIKSTDTTLTIPKNSKNYKALIKISGDIVVVALNEPAVLPSSSSFVATSSELVPTSGYFCREVKGGDVLHFMCLTEGTVINVCLFSYLSNN
jgi:hypothetical protein